MVKERTSDANPDLETAFRAYLLTPGEERLAELAVAAERLIRHFASIYAPDRVNEDVLQAGFEGLLKAVEKYDASSGFTFTTYAGHCIMGEIRHYVRKEASHRRLGCISRLQDRVDQVVSEEFSRTGTVPTLGGIAECVNVREEGLIQAMTAGWVSLDEVDLNRIHGKRYESFRLPIEDRIVLEQAIEKLSDLQRKVIFLLFYRDMTQVEAAQELGITQRKVSRLLRKSLEQMAEALA
ncbi:MAG: sigma-70 family RNA polymerase sigma factor [Bacillota bacterium]